MSEKTKDYFLFIAGILGAFQFRFVGTFYGVEIIAFVCYIIFRMGRYRRNPQARRFMKLSILWLVGAVVANLWNGNEMEPSLKGIFNIVFFIAQIPFVYWALYDKVSRWIYFYTGYAISTILNFYFFRFGNLEDEALQIWLFYSWTQLAVAISAILYYKNYHKSAYIFAIGFGIFGLFSGSRNMFLTLAIASIILFYVDNVKGNNTISRISIFRRNIASLVIALVCGGYIVSNTYEYLASNGILGEAAYNKYIMQKYSQMGLASGRGDFIIGVEFLARNPIVGYGSFAKDKEELRPKLSIKYGIDYSERLAIENGYVIPCHSVLIGQWNWHGILAGTFWLWYLMMIYRAFRKGIFLVNPKLMGLGIFVSMMMIWDILFSPMAARTPYVFFMIYLILLNTEYKNKAKQYQQDEDFNNNPVVQSGTVSGRNTTINRKSKLSGRRNYRYGWWIYR